jgi:hypothetical protein
MSQRPCIDILHPLYFNIGLRELLHFVSHEMGQRSLKHVIMDTYFQTFPLVLLRERSGNSTCKACKPSIEWGNANAKPRIDLIPVLYAITFHRHTMAQENLVKAS